MSARPEVNPLRDARATERLPEYLAELWRRREWGWYVATSDLRSRQINSVLGNLWHLINPLLQISVFFVIFGLVLDVTRGVENFLGYLTIGIFTYTFTQKSVIAGGRSLLKYRGLVQIVAFPRAMLPITTTLTETFAIIPGYLVMLAVALITGEPLGFAWFVLIPVFVVHGVFNAGLALVTARVSHRLPDVQQVLPFIFRLGFYASGVLFNISAYVESSNYRLLFELNPLYCFIEINRGILLQDRSVPFDLVGIAAIWTVVAAVGGFWWFRAAEDRYGDG